jgi:hypothetical protein
MLHDWSNDENLVAYYLFRFPDSEIASRKQQIADHLGVALGTLMYRVGSIKAASGYGNLHGYSKAATRIYTAYRGKSDAEVRDMTLSALDRLGYNWASELEAKA